MLLDLVIRIWLFVNYYMSLILFLLKRHVAILQATFNITLLFKIILIEHQSNINYHIISRHFNCLINIFKILLTYYLFKSKK